MTKFIGRKKELDSLKGLLLKKKASLVVIRGRRRIGKSRLAEEFAKSFPKTFSLSGIPPVDGITAEMQRVEFVRQLQEYKIPIYKSDDWGTIFHDLAQVTKKGRVLILLDEITWMGSKDVTFLPKLKNAWDAHFKKNPELILIISGSNSAWIEKNILSSTGFFGRVSLRMLLKELPLSDCNFFWNLKSHRISAYEKFTILSITGGIPRYLEELREDLSTEQNIIKLCFDPEGLLFLEFDQIFHDLFQKKGPFYKQILQILINHHLSMSELAVTLNRSKGGDLSEALDDLTQAGFLARDYTWDLKKEKMSHTNRYRVCDNYMRFYLKYIEPNKEQIKLSQVRSLPKGWSSILGLQFENLVASNSAELFPMLHIPSEEILLAGPYLQSKTARRKSCQIDYLIQTRFHALYLCEVKFSLKPIGMDVVSEVKEKMEALQLPRGFSCRPILIHINGVQENVIDSGFFSQIIDFSDFFDLKTNS